MSDNLILHPKAKFLLNSYAPLTFEGDLANVPYGLQNTYKLFNKNNLLANCDLQNGKMIALCLAY